MYIDAHTHAFLPEDLKVLGERLALLDASLESSDPHKWQLHGPGDVESLLEMEARAGVERLVLLPVTGRKERVAELNRWTSGEAARHPELIPFGILHPHGKVEEELALALELGIKGIKLHPFIQRYTLKDPAVFHLLELVAEAGLPVMLDTLDLEGLLRFKPHLKWVAEAFAYQGVSPEQMASLAKRLPGIKLIAAHGGCLYGWQRVGPLMDLDNVYIDLSYLNGLLEPERVADLVRRKGVERVLYGSDAPWREAGAYREWFDGLPLDPAELEPIRAANLSELLGL